MARIEDFDDIIVTKFSRAKFEPNSMESGDGGGEGADFDKDEEAETKADLLRDRFRLSVISIANAEAKKAGMEMSDPVVACVADLAFKYTGASNLGFYIGVSMPPQIEQLAKDVELFAQHAGRKSVNMEDVILSAHRNEHLTSLLRSFSQELKGKEPQTDRKRKRS